MSEILKTPGSSLDNKVIFVTGGSRGIGKAIAKRCAAQGAKLAISARSHSEVETAAAEIQNEFKVPVLGLVCDVSIESQVIQTVTTIEKQLGPIYGLVAAAGIYGSIGPFEDVSFNEWKQAIEVNLIGAALCIHKVVPLMKARKEGRIILFSGGGEGPMPRFSPYVASKGAIWRLTETLGAEFAPAGIYVNAVAPGAINTKLLDDLLALGPEKVGSEFYQKSLQQKQSGGADVEKACSLVLYLLSQQSEGLYGKILSALWDKYTEFKNLEALSKSKLYAMRRVVDG